VLRALYRKSGDEALATRELERYQKALLNQQKRGVKKIPWSGADALSAAYHLKPPI